MNDEKRENRIVIIIVAVLIILLAATFTFFWSKGFFKSDVPFEPSSVITTRTEENEVTIPLSSINHEFHIKEIIGRVVSDDFDINCNLYWGTTKECLRYGAGIHKCSSLPGMVTPLTYSATCPIIAAHCTTEFKNFKILDPNSSDFTEGLTITLSMPYGDYVYEVKSVEIINADDFKFSDFRASSGNFNPNIAIFYTCYPFERVDYTKYERLFLFCELISGDKVIDDTLDITTTESATEGLAALE